MKKVVSVQWDEEYGCYDVRVGDDQATVADFEAECEQVLSASSAVRSYSEQCPGCCLCCSERIPVTAIDLLRIDRGFFEKRTLEDMEEVIRIAEFNGCYDITLQTDSSEICKMWDKERQLCRIYQKRAFACRTYICAPMSWRMEELRSQIINKGEDALVKLLVPEAREYQKLKSAFDGVQDYGELLIRDVCSKRLWNSLRRG